MVLICLGPKQVERNIFFLRKRNLWRNMTRHGQYSNDNCMCFSGMTASASVWVEHVKSGAAKRRNPAAGEHYHYLDVCGGYE